MRLVTMCHFVEFCLIVFVLKCIILKNNFLDIFLTPFQKRSINQRAS